MACGRGEALYDYVPQADNDISLGAGATVHVLAIDTGKPEWWEVECNGEVGYVPASYVKIECTENRTFLAVVVFNFEPQSDEELQMFAGENVLVLEDDDDKWWYGMVLPEDAGATAIKSGYFPSNYVEKVESDESEKAKQQREMRHRTMRKMRKNPPRPVSKISLRPAQKKKSAREHWSVEELQAMVGEQRIRKRIEDQQARTSKEELVRADLQTRELLMMKKEAELEQRWEDLREAVTGMSCLTAERERQDLERMQEEASKVSAREAQVAQQEQVLAEWQSQLEELEQILAVKDGELEQREVALDCLKQELEMSKVELEEREAELRARGEELAEMERQLVLRECDIEGRERAVAAKEQELADRKREAAAGVRTHSGTDNDDVKKAKELQRELNRMKDDMLMKELELEAREEAVRKREQSARQ